MLNLNRCKLNEGRVYSVPSLIDTADRERFAHASKSLVLSSHPIDDGAGS